MLVIQLRAIDIINGSMQIPSLLNSVDHSDHGLPISQLVLLKVQALFFKLSGMI